jgi:hypothetical protein
LTVAGAALSIMLVSACSTGGDPSPESTTDSAATNLDVAVATNEPWGTYHLDDVLPTAQDRDVTVTLVIPDEAPADDALDEDSPVPTLPLSQAQDEDFWSSTARRNGRARSRGPWTTSRSWPARPHT